MTDQGTCLRCGVNVPLFRANPGVPRKYATPMRHLDSQGQKCPARAGWVKTELILKQRALVRVGQIWEDCDPRTRERPQVEGAGVHKRRLRVRALEPEALPTYAVCVPGDEAVPLKDFRTSRIRIDRFRSLATGYRLVSDPEKVGVYLNGELSLHAIVDGLLEPRPPVFGKQDVLGTTRRSSHHLRGTHLRPSYAGEHRRQRQR